MGERRLSPRQLLSMFWVFFKIGAFTLGGGYAMIPLMKVEIVDRQNWLEEKEFLDIIAVAQCSPGAVAINSSVYIGYRLFGLAGAVIATLGTVLPSFLSILSIALVYTGVRAYPAVQKAFRGIYPALVVLILAAVFNLQKAAFKNRIDVAVAITGLIALVVFDVHPILVILASGITGLIRYFAGGRRERSAGG
ncbi:chromate transporter [Thermosediminibacter oceani]|uniref:Chromate transporter n=1 Tax=Thermosediminibacter oceani (strain ATCC BAA-1034 / DSM 16646 / JW/IW-1228P) TaxID=555079 RepID=D9S008_THEOJ|nr:chromate transporter [Thermosediminibacter oceani]ADL08785.1 Chromate transporter [Thermosediminibacter oceani DSM 16646]